MLTYESVSHTNKQSRKISNRRKRSSCATMLSWWQRTTCTNSSTTNYALLVRESSNLHIVDWSIDKSNNINIQKTQLRLTIIISQTISYIDIVRTTIRQTSVRLDSSFFVTIFSSYSTYRVFFATFVSAWQMQEMKVSILRIQKC